MPNTRSDYVSPERKRSGYASAGVGVTAATVFLLLCFLDIISPTGAPLNAASAAIGYAVKTGIGIAAVIFGVFYLKLRSTPIIVNISIIIYAIIVIIHSAIWLANSSSKPSTNFVTYLANPSFSIWSWLFILIIPIFADQSARDVIVRSLRRIPTIPLIAILVAGSVLSIAGHITLSLASTAIGTTFLVCLKGKRSFLSRMAASIQIAIAAISMLILDNRIYFVALSILAVTYIVFWRFPRYLMVTGMCLFIMTPLIFETVFPVIISAFSLEHESISNDTRSFLYTELFADLSESEVYFGKGLDGQYFSPYFANIAKNGSSIVGLNNIWRTSVEVSWLNMILKFGLFGLIPFLFCILSPIISTTRAAHKYFDLDGVRRFMTVLILIYVAELPNQISLSYFCLFASVGLLIGKPPTLRSRQDVMTL